MQVSKRINPDQLQQELLAAGVVVSGLWTHGDPQTDVGAYDASGEEIDLPASAQAVVDAHVAQDPIAQARDAKQSAIALVLNNTSVLQTGKEPERDAWCDLLGCERLSLLTAPIPATQAVTKTDIVLREAPP